ncbi:hypothetical protein F5884DRAFT_266312 [Xylogone sp. PMI_703]|nr:hypothetical protein F5884DRAFT_266312 [Xylogone sp. PMI_703]
MSHSIVYFTTVVSPSQRDAILDALNAPNRQYTELYNLPDLLVASEKDTVGKSTKQIVDLHKKWIQEEGIPVNDITSLFTIVDKVQDSAPYSETVELVNISPEEPNPDHEEYDSMRVPIAETVSIITVIDGGQQGWDFFVDLAKSKKE